MSKKHRHRRRCEEELDLIPRKNVFPQNSPQGADDSSLAFIGLLEMLGSQFNIFGNNKQNNNEDLSSNVQTEDDNNAFNVYEEKQEVLNTEVDDSIEHSIENIVEDVEYEVKENIVEDIDNSNVTDIYDVEDSEDECNINITENIEEIENFDEINNINDIELAENQVTVHCKAKVSNNTVLECCSSKNIKSKFIKEPVVCKLPVIISQIEIPISIETLIKFNEAVFKIIDLNKEVFLESCNLINNSNKFFIKGVIRENITYSNINSATDYAVSGNVKNLEVDIPFKCSTKVCFNSSPVSNNKIYCKMDSTNILETMSQEELKDVKNTLPKTHTFKEVRKKIILNLGLSLLQEQYVFIDK